MNGKHLIVGLSLFALIALGLAAAVAADMVTSEAEVVITAERQRSGDIHLGLKSAEGRVISPGEDNIFRRTMTRATSARIAVETTREPQMDSERVVSGRGEHVGEIEFSPGLWLCSTTFNTIQVSRWSEAEFHLVIGEGEYSGSIVGYYLYGSGAVFLIKAGVDSVWSEGVPANVALPVTPLQARSGHQWELYCNRVQHRD